MTATITRRAFEKVTTPNSKKHHLAAPAASKTLCGRRVDGRLEWTSRELCSTCEQTKASVR